MSKFQQGFFEKSLFKKVLFYYKKCFKIPKSGNILEKYFKIFFLAILESRHHNLRKYAKKNLKFCPSLTYTEDIVESTFYSKTAVFWTFLKNPSLEFAHIRSTYSPDLSWLYPALGIDVQFRRHISWKKIRCAIRLTGCVESM